MATFVTPRQAVSTLYPFTGQNSPAVNQIFKDIKISLAVKDVSGVFLKHLNIKQGYIVFQLAVKTLPASQPRQIVIFQYSGIIQPWLNIKQDTCYGFIRFAQMAKDMQFVLPNQVQLHRKTYYIQQPDGGVQSLYVQNTRLPVSNTLNILFRGDLQCSKTLQTDGTVTIHIKNVFNNVQKYYALDLTQQSFVYSINNKRCQHFIIQSSSPAIQISGPFKVAQDTYVLQLDTDKTFPTCSRQAMESL